MASNDTATPPHAVSSADTCTARSTVRALASDLPPHDVDDIAQEVLCALAFHRKPMNARTGRAARTARWAFLWREAARQLAEHERRQAEIGIGDRLALDVLPPPVTPSAEDLSLAFVPIGRLRRALARLREEDATAYAVLDLALDGAPMTMATGALGIPEGTAHTRLRRARTRIRALLGTHANTGGCT